MTGMIEGFFFMPLKFSIPGFFSRKNLASIFLGWPDLSGFFFCIKSNLKICGSALAA